MKMFVNIVYDIPNLLLGFIIVGGIVLIAVIGYMIVRKFISEDKRHINNIITSALSQMSGVFCDRSGIYRDRYMGFIR